MFIYSGDSRKGKLGTPTDLKDIDGKNLFVGDIVLLLYKDECRERIEGLTAVVDDSYISYQDGTYVDNPDKGKAFIMGIKDEDMVSGKSCWNVKRVKHFSQVISGEKWLEYGFNYKND